MSESKLKILKMLEEGKITFEQAQELLKATSDNKESGKHSFWKNMFIDFLKEVEIFDDKKIKDVFLIKQKIEKDVLFFDINSINGKINISYSDNENIYISGEVVTKNKKEKYIDINFKNNIFEIKPIDSDIKGLDLEIQIPKNKYNTLKATTSNDKIKLINLNTISEYDIETTNGALIIDRVIGKKINGNTNNSKISLKESKLENIELKTSNGEIIVYNLVVDNKTKLSAITSNSLIKIEFDNDYLQNIDFIINAKTSNSNIKVDLPNLSKKSNKELIIESNNNFENVLTINAKTSNSDIFIGSK